MSSQCGYLIDSDVLITAKNRYYTFSICPGFWDSILHNHTLGHIHSIDHVKEEFLRGRNEDELAKWVDQRIPEGFFLSTNVGEIVDTFRKPGLEMNQQLDADQMRQKPPSTTQELRVF